MEASEKHFHHGLVCFTISQIFIVCSTLDPVIFAPLTSIAYSSQNSPNKRKACTINANCYQRELTGMLDAVVLQLRNSDLQHHSQEGEPTLGTGLLRNFWVLILEMVCVPCSLGLPVLCYILSSLSILYVRMRIGKDTASPNLPDFSLLFTLMELQCAMLVQGHLVTLNYAHHLCVSPLIHSALATQGAYNYTRGSTVSYVCVEYGFSTGPSVTKQRKKRIHFQRDEPANKTVRGTYTSNT